MKSSSAVTVAARKCSLIPDLTELQIKSYEDFLQADVPGTERGRPGLESILREVFPIESYDGNLRLEYISYDLGEPRYTPDECRRCG